MFKEMIMKTMLNKQLAHIPQEQREKIMSAITNNPELFTTIAKEVQEKTNNGKSQLQAVQEIMQEHGEELKTLLQ